ncbi:TetR family transcriptional regulator [Propioniciclava sp.]|uniref:TetR/AcrR family transcriptional regulator n=1 Tax=Propioniciclava sp. TaxID=2038686 RepID=UPI00262A245D|nr:TetR family transcriptional regulator [Propioniciclava sp.]
MKTPPEQPAGSAAEATEARTPVTKDLLFRRALAIVDAEGLSALTMRRLAADLGVEAASLYHHVPNKQAVLDGAVSVMREDMVFDEPIPSDWRGILEMVFMRYLDLLTAHPNMLPLAARHVPTDPADGLVYLVATGLSEADAVAAWQSVLAFVVGWATFAGEAITGDVDYLPPGLAERMRQWDAATARHALRAMLESYEVTPASTSRAGVHLPPRGPLPAPASTYLPLQR